MVNSFHVELEYHALLYNLYRGAWVMDILYHKSNMEIVYVQLIYVGLAQANLNNFKTNLCYPSVYMYMYM